MLAVIVVEDSNLPHKHLMVLAIYLTVGLSVFAYGLSAAAAPAGMSSTRATMRRRRQPPRPPSHEPRTRSAAQRGSDLIGAIVR